MDGFNHKISFRVQFHEVDLLGVVNNAVYFNYFETARIEYLKAVGQFRDVNKMQPGDNFFLIARNECDYIEPALFDDEVNVYTRVGSIKNSSFTFEHLVENAKNGKVLAKGGGVMVHINSREKKSTPLPEEFYKSVKSYDTEVKVIKNGEEI
ncbi:MAG: acyl-CoA thioesterase [Bacteroidota bacterium]|jgi:acyl-CoA thioester hydrolase|nr:acyl-CoA thioesterase [Ignavibacteria bacterium]MCU7499813.1 acyl-CoA thioesterase [Ignavibacteria bacterium]MCU7513294.1 acyl-CoA thioesterase [Ignavibacteria bacterium]MCU7522143.1 acyl-CoA thioesterase [Ignavibacteria bacterium]MCU7525756.1 acyl-CoA thioesterase [Ignavibacteria bacterium]